MKEWEKEWIRSNHMKLFKGYTFNTLVLESLVEKKLLLDYERDEWVRIYNNVKFGGYEANRTLYVEFLFPRKDTYDVLIEVLLNHGKTEEAEILKNGRSAETMRILVETDSDELDFVNNKTPLKIVVKQPLTGFVRKSDDKIYKLDKSKKKLGLVINIKKFKSQHKYRQGSEHDVNYMVNLLKGLNFEIFPSNPRNENYTKTKLLEELKSFKDACSSGDVDAIMIFIGSHGSRDHITTFDDKNKEEEVHIYKDIVDEFHHHIGYGCPSLKGRPKIFIFNTCQVYPQDEQDTQVQKVKEEVVVSGKRKRSSSESHAVVKKSKITSSSSKIPIMISEEKSPSTSTTSKTAGPSTSKKSKPLPIVPESTIEDTIVIFPQIPGQKANRDKYRGSWFVLVFAFVVMQLAADESFMKMMETVPEVMKKIKSTNYAPQTPQYTIHPPFKTLYLFSD